jgi:preprotein translocase subunit SecA
MGGEIFQGALRFVALSSLDELWMEHLDSMDHLRDSVRLRGYGQRDPLIEYKREGHQMFQRMLKEINRQIAHLIYKVNIQVEPQAKPVQTVTNQPGAKGSVPSTDPKYEGVGRNDLCPCGSGKKFKRCHGK